MGFDNWIEGGRFAVSFPTPVWQPGQFRVQCIATGRLDFDWLLRQGNDRPLDVVEVRRLYERRFGSDPAIRAEFQAEYRRVISGPLWAKFQFSISEEPPYIQNILVGLRRNLGGGANAELSTEVRDWIERMPISGNTSVEIFNTFPIENWRFRIRGVIQVRLRIGPSDRLLLRHGVRIWQELQSLARRYAPQVLASRGVLAAWAGYAAIGLAGAVGYLCLWSYHRELMRHESYNTGMRSYFASAYFRVMFWPNDSAFNSWWNGLSEFARTQGGTALRRGYDAAHNDILREGIDEMRIFLCHHIVAYHHQSIQDLQGHRDRSIYYLSEYLKDHRLGHGRDPSRS